MKKYKQKKPKSQKQTLRNLWLRFWWTVRDRRLNEKAVLEYKKKGDRLIGKVGNGCTPEFKLWWVQNRTKELIEKRKQSKKK